MRFTRGEGFLKSFPAACLLLGLPAFGQQFNSNDVTPPGSASAKLNGTSSGKQVGGGSNSHAILIGGNALSAIDLHPANYYSSMATAMDDLQQCGYGSAPLGGIHALVWSGSATSSVDLQPSGFNFSYCTGVYQGQQVGFAENQVYFLTTSHAMLWHGSGVGVADLHPPTFAYSRAMGIRSGEEVGYGSSIAYPYGESLGYHTTSHALRWTGSAASVVDLHPAGFDASEALATNGSQQGGWGYSATPVAHQHALLWAGTAASAVDLHPVGFHDSKITALTATQQVGEGWIGTPGAVGSVRHAFVWSGTPESAIDLNQYLPTGYTNAVATGIDANGNVVGYAYNTYSIGNGPGPDAIAVIFAPGQAPAAAVSSLTLNPANTAPGSTVQATVTLGGPAPAAGVNLTFLSTNPALAATPLAVTIPLGQSSATFSISVGGAALTVPAALKIYATDGTFSRLANLTVTPVVTLSSVTVNGVEGGFITSGTIGLSIPAQAGGATVSLVSSNPALVTLPASVTLPWGYSAISFTATTSTVTAITPVPITATFNGVTLSSSVSLNPAPVVAVSSLTFPPVVGGQSLTGTIVLTNFPRDAGGATVTLISADPTVVQVPATVLVPQGAYSAIFTATTSAVSGIKGVAIKASYNGSQVTGTASINPIPKVTIISAEYFTDTKLFKVQASTTFANSILTYGTDPNSPPVGTMQIELGVYKGSTIMAAAPALATIWNSNGGQATMAVTVKTPAAAGGGGGTAGGGGGGGGSSSTGTFKLTVTRTGKGSVVSSPASIACGVGVGSCSAPFSAGTSVTLTATPDPIATWVGWSGGCTGPSLTCTVTVTADTSVTANFK
ncbi:MAG: hypothetical protein M3Z36_04810 [Acidobacteriota bacterium]|nr:hypothetical protein [Acidobacteriota bacterium]